MNSENKLPYMKQVTAAIIIQNGNVLLTRRSPGESLPGYWEFPGGKIEDGETPQVCLERELKEELCITTKAGQIIAGLDEWDIGQGNKL